MKNRIFLLIAAAVLTFTGCGKTVDQPQGDLIGSVQEAGSASEEIQSDTRNETQENSGGTQEDMDIKEPVAEEVFSNGGTFVKVGTKVYYRQYPAEAYTSSALWGYFINGMPCGQECSIMCYDEAVGGEALEVMADDGYGPLVYCDGFLFSTYNINNSEFYVYAIDLKEKTSEKLCDGQIRCVDSETGCFVAVQERNDVVYFYVCRGKEVLDSFSVKNIQSFREMCLHGDYLVYRALDGYEWKEDIADQLWVRNIREKTDLCLGDIQDVEDMDYYFGKDIDQLVIHEDMVYAGVGFYAGTGNFYQEGYFCKASLKQENSLESAEWDSMKAVPWMEYDGASAVLESALPELVRTDRQLYSVSEDYETKYFTVTLPGDDPTAPVIKNVLQIPEAFGEDMSAIVEKKEYVDGGIYMIIDDVEYNPEESIGWRDAYDARRVRYVRADVETGEMKDIQPPAEIAGTMADGSLNGQVISYYIENPAAGECYGASDITAAPISFTELSRDESDYIDENLWMTENQFTLQDLYCPGYSFGLSDAYERETHRGYCLWVYGEGNGAVSYEIDLSDFYDPVNCLEEQYLNSGWPAEYEYAYVEDNILYVAMYHMTYASSMPYNAYIVAIDLSDGTLLWKSRPLTCNSRNFLLMDDVIICGYGFTAEDDYLYQLSKYTGEIVQTTKLRSKAYYILYRDDHLYVQTYNTAYEYSR